MVSKGNHPQMALIQISELLYIIFPDILNYSYKWLVVSNVNFIFHNVWDVILPIDFPIFQDG